MTILLLCLLAVCVAYILHQKITAKRAEVQDVQMAPEAFKKFEDANKIIEDPLVKMGLDFSSKLHHTLVLGQTRYMCRYGTLSDGHEKVTDAQRYYQSVREMYGLSQTIKSFRLSLMNQKANLLDAEELLKAAKKESDVLRAKAKFLEAHDAIQETEIQLRDKLRQLDEYNKVYQELHPIISVKYPNGIEEAEPDNWQAVYEYRMMKQFPGAAPEITSNIPLDPVSKAKLGLQYNRPDSVAPLLTAFKNEYDEFAKRLPNPNAVSLDQLEQFVENIETTNKLPKENTPQLEALTNGN